MEDLLDITRIIQKKVVLNKEVVSLNTIINDAVLDIMPQFEKKSKQLLKYICDKPIAVNGDPLRITQCIVNVLKNALKFTKENGTVSISLCSDEKYAIVEIQDNGIGISPEMLPVIFEPFKQDNKASNAFHNMGVGLGLAIVKDYMELHDGEVTASSPGIGKGSLFTMRLPVL